MPIPNVLFRYLILIAMLGLTLGLDRINSLTAQSTCSHFASPGGSGNGLSATSPFSVSSFWAVAGPGKTLCLLDGVYTSAGSMITPPQNLNGTATSPITLRALNDGGVLIDGRGARQPFLLHNNDWWIIQGINVANSSADVVAIYGGADNNIVRRVVAWNAADANTSIFGVHGNTGNTLEDVAGFGTARKIFQNSFGGNNLTIRRAWGMWNKSTWNTPAIEWPKMTFSIAYESYNTTCENCIATQDIDQGSRTDFIYSLLGTDWFPDSTNKCANSQYLGSVAYTTSGQTVDFISALYSGQDIDCMRFENVAVHLETSQGTTSLQRFSAGTSKSHIVNRATEIGSGSSFIGSDWTVSGREKVSSAASASNVWSGSGTSGARLCYQYRNGLLTNVPLWPWPMNQRILDALKTAGRQPVDVTATMEQKFGPIPSQCRSSLQRETTPPQTVSPPANVKITTIP